LRAGLIPTEKRTFNLRFLQPVDPLVANQPSQASENLKNSPIPLWRNGRGPVERAHFGRDGFQKRDRLGNRTIWRIPVMEGEFAIEDTFGVRRGVAGGNFIIMADSQVSGLDAAEKAVDAMGTVEGVVLTFPGGICRSGSKVGSMKYKLPASTNHPFCPTLRTSISDSKVPETVRSAYELVFNGLDTEIVKKATGVGVAAAA